MTLLGKALLVCAEDCAEVERSLISAGVSVIKANNGPEAVLRARREIFEAAVLVSTGREMDLAETVFNLIDVRGSMKIIIVSANQSSKRARSAENLARWVQNVKLVDVGELESLLRSESSGKK